MLVAKPTVVKRIRDRSVGGRIDGWRNLRLSRLRNRISGKENLAAPRSHDRPFLRIATNLDPNTLSFRHSATAQPSRRDGVSYVAAHRRRLGSVVHQFLEGKDYRELEREPLESNRKRGSI